MKKFGKRVFVVAITPLALLAGIVMGVAHMLDALWDMWRDTDAWEIKP